MQRQDVSKDTVVGIDGGKALLSRVATRDSRRGIGRLRSPIKNRARQQIRNRSKRRLAWTFGHSGICDQAVESGIARHLKLIRERGKWTHSGCVGHDERGSLMRE